MKMAVRSRSQDSGSLALTLSVVLRLRKLIDDITARDRSTCCFVRQAPAEVMQMAMVPA